MPKFSMENMSEQPTEGKQLKTTYPEKNRELIDNHRVSTAPKTSCKEKSHLRGCESTVIVMDMMLDEGASGWLSKLKDNEWRGEEDARVTIMVGHWGR